MTAKNRVAVRIGGKEYTIVGLESRSYLQKVASYIDKKYNEVQKSNPMLSSSMVFVLTAVNIADDLFKLIDNEAAAVEKLDKISEENENLRHQLAQRAEEVELLNNKNSDLAKELAEMEIEFSEYRSSYERLPKVKFYSK